MLTKEGCLIRQKRLWDTLPESVEWVIITNPRHVKYFSNIWVNPVSFSAGQSVWLHMKRSGKVTALSDNFTFKSLSGEAFVDETVEEVWYDGVHSVENRDHMPGQALKKTFGTLHLSEGIFEWDSFPAAGFETVEGEPPSDLVLGDVIKKLRRQKDPDEIEHLKSCMGACEAGHVAGKEIVKPGVTDMDVYRAVNNAVLEHVGRPCVVYGDFRATNAETPKVGGLPVSYTLQDGDLFLLDYSVVLEGYRSDFTNTIAVGTPSPEQDALLNACLASLESGEKVLRSNATCREVFATCSKRLVKEGFNPLPHHAGHGLGLEHPEPPVFVPESTDILMNGDVVTVEPGNYIPGVGGVRIERNYLITKKGSENLSHHKISLK